MAFGATPVYSQAMLSKTDSIKLQLQHAKKEDNVKVNLLLDLAQAFKTTEPDSVVYYSHLALHLSRKLNYTYGITLSNLFLFQRYTAPGWSDSAKYYALVTIPLMKALPNDQNLAYLYQSLAYEFIQDRENTYSANGQKALQKAKTYIDSAIEVYRKIPDTSNIIYTLARKGEILMNLQEMDAASSAFAEAIHINDEAGLQNVWTLYVMYGEFMFTNGKPDSSNILMNKALEITTQEEIYTGKAYILGCIALNYKALGNNKKAMAYAKEGLALADEEKLIKEKRGLLSILYTLHKDLGDYKESLDYYEQLQNLEDSISSNEFEESLAGLNLRLESQKSKDEIALLLKDQEIQNEKSARQRIIVISLIGGLSLLCIIAIILLNRFQIKQKALRISEKQKILISREKEISEKLLLNILPQEVAEELKLKGSADAKLFEMVTVMFTDFKEFTRISEKLSPAELVTEIDTCFKNFDKIIDKYNIEKIKTIGDSYMCAGGLPVKNASHAVDVINAAKEIQEFMHWHTEQRKNSGKEIFEVRIGIHSGPVVAGIVGVKKFAYDIWGDTVNIASRIESSGEAGKINISGSTYNLVKDQFICQYRGKIDAKHKGEIEMYFVE